jgi:acyl-CoA reductase-like NAD-dependent aldehyde dehydrogenase
VSEAAGTPGELRARIEGALAAREELRARPLADTIAALEEAALSWSQDRTLAAELPLATRLSPAMIAAVMPIAAATLDAAAMTELVEDEWGRGAAERPPAPGPGLVAHVLASNVPALALPAIALACLAGAAVVVKSGRRDALSAPAFVYALANVDPELAATIVTEYWPGGDLGREDALLARADVVVLTGGDEAIAALAGRAHGRVLAHGPRASVAALGRSALGDTRAATALALDVALHDQRGCLSPHAVYVETGGDVSPRDFADHLADALGEIARSLPRGEVGIEERAAVRACADEVEFLPGGIVLDSAEGKVLYDELTTFRPTAGLRTIRVHPLDDVRTLPEILPIGTIECVGLAGLDAAPLVAGLRARGVSRLCPVGAMQQPLLSWPRGQQPPLGALVGRASEPLLAREI